MLTFKQAVESLGEDHSKSLFIANGFSQAWSARIFNYANLFQAADFGDKASRINNIFEKLNTYDFERVSKHLTAAEDILSFYEAGNLSQEISNDKDVLKSALIRAISDTHPDRPMEITDDQYKSVRNFISNFDKLFTVNYDLLVYWAKNKEDIEPSGFNFDDGFRAGKKWTGDVETQRIFFLHGGLHIYDDGASIKKHFFSECDGSIVDKVRSNLNSGSFPLFVSEPDADKKKSRIERNPYLNYCYRSLKNLEGALFIYGHSMDENDKHLFDKIKESNITHLFVSIYGDEESDVNVRLKANARAFLEGKGREIIFYRAESTPIWADLS